MSVPFADLMKDLALARGNSDPDARAMRRRIAIMVYPLGGGAVLWLAGWVQSVVVGLAGFGLLLVALWLFAERGDRIYAGLRRQIGKKA